MPMACGQYWRVMVAANFALFVAVCAGCKSAAVPVEESRLSKLTVLYGRYVGQNKGKSPPNEGEFKKFISKIDEAANLDELFVSPRDSQPYVIRYNVAMGTPGAATVTVYEKTGVDGKRMVGLNAGEVKTVDEAEFRKLLPILP